jgi:sensor histidine kinase YesM
MLAELSDLLRSYLQEDARAEVPVREEAALLERYLRLQRMRYGDRLRATVTLDDEAALVPRLVLQPLVENALRHGADRRPGPFTLRVEGRRADGMLHLVVEDDGPGLPPDPPAGVGLANTLARLRQLHGDRAAMTLGRSSLGGARVALALPARDA